MSVNRAQVCSGQQPGGLRPYLFRNKTLSSITPILLKARKTVSYDAYICVNDIFCVGP